MIFKRIIKLNSFRILELIKILQLSIENVHKHIPNVRSSFIKPKVHLGNTRPHFLLMSFTLKHVPSEYKI